MYALPPAPAPAPRRQVFVGTAVGSAAAAMFMGGMLAVWWRFREASGLRQGANGMIRDWKPKAVSIPEVPTNVMLFTMLMAIVMAQLGVWGAKRGDRQNTLLGVALTGVMGVAMVNAQAMVYAEMKMGISQHGSYSMMFYAVTGTFIVLTIIGMLFSLLTVFRVVGTKRADHEMVSAHALYWYVLAGIFAALWFVVYVTK